MSEKHFTTAEYAGGACAVRRMSGRASVWYAGTDEVKIAEYIDYDLSREAEEKAERAGVDFFAGELDVKRYAVIYAGAVAEGLTFEETEKYLEGLVGDEDF